MKILNLFNLRTFFVLVISQVAAFLAIRFQIKFNIDVVLFGLAVAFPLAFSLQAAFKRRERALEYFSRFKAATVALDYSCRISKKVLPEKKAEFQMILLAMVERLMSQLEQRIISYTPMQDTVDKVYEFIEANRKELSNRNVLRMIRYINQVTESSVYLISLVRHRTMTGIRFYAITFILIFPMVQAPIMYYRLDGIVPSWCIHMILALTSLILVMLSNFQHMIEYPFDSKGMDNIHIRDFRMDMKKP